MAEYALWPVCAVCTMASTEGTQVVVEEYGCERRDAPKLSLYREVVILEAACSHGRGFRPGTIERQHKRINVPYWWGEAHIQDEIRGTVFFTPGQGPPEQHLVTHVV